jgi:hypothetical protein
VKGDLVEEETFEAKVERFADELRKTESGCTVIIFAVRGVDKSPHAPITVVMKGDDTTANLGLLQIGHDMGKAMIYSSLGLLPNGLPIEDITE